MISKQNNKIPQYVPVIKTPREVKEATLRIIKDEASGHQLGLRTRFSSLNRGLGKYFRFKQVYSFAGPSGHGKSTLLNILIQDFLNPELNRDNCYYDYIICHHGFEMTPEDEELRKVSGKMKVSYNYLLSSEFNGKTQSYNTLDQSQIEDIKKVLEEDDSSPIYYFDEPCELANFAINIKAAIADYKVRVFNDKERLSKLYTKLRKQHPNLEILDPLEPDHIPSPKIVMTLDHTMLIKPAKDEYDLLQTMRNLAKTAISLKKKGYLVLFLNQFNNNIEKSERLRTPEMQFPIKSDVYAQGEIFNACDGVFTIYQPLLAGIQWYGIDQYLTVGLVHLQALKMRFGKVGSVWLRNMLNEGNFGDIPREELIASKRENKKL